MTSGLCTGVYKSLVSDRYGLIPTTELAIAEKLGAVQLYLNDRFAGDLDYLENLIAKLKTYQGQIVIHLPDDYHQINEWHIQAAELIISSLPNKKISVLTHYSEDMSVDDVPIVNGKPVGIENSLTGEFDPAHVMRAYELALQAGSFFVFDFGRMMYIRQGDFVTAKIILRFVSDMIRCLRPGVDVAHAADKLNWQEKYGKCGTFLGDPQGVGYSLLPVLAEFSRNGGIVIFEQESEELALKSIEYLTQWERLGS